MNILLLTFYYPPDLSAGSFRAVALVKAMKELDKTASITVLTTQPNRYNDLSKTVSEIERLNSVTIRRISLPAHKGGVLDQARAFFKYARQARAIAKQDEWSVVVATSSRLMTAFVGATIANSIKAPLYLDIRDLFVDTIEDVFHPFLLKFVVPVFRRVERYTFNSATKLNVVSQGFIPYADKVAPSVEKTVLTNGVDEEFVFNTSVKNDRVVSEIEPVVVLYAGNVGEGQGLHKVLPAAARKLGKKVHFKIIGSGGCLAQLRDAASEVANDSLASHIEILPPVPRVELIKEYKRADILFVHLNDYSAFEKVLPSKIFEYAATGAPIIAGVAGYAAEFIRSEVDNALVFQPCEGLEFSDAIEAMLDKLQPVNRSQFCEKYARTRIMRSMAEDVLSLAQNTGLNKGS